MRLRMHPILHAFESMIMTPILVTQAAFTQMVQLHREQTTALTKVLESVVGRAVLGNGTVNWQPKQDDLFVGKSVSQTKTLTDLHTVFFGALSLDFNPLHFNEELARSTRFQGRIIHGFHTASLFSGVLAELTPWCVYLHQDMDFTAPVRPGEIITATGTIEDIDLKGVIRVALACRNQKDEVVVRGRAIVKKLKEMYQENA
jgi:3-hydroxybutyryl-CoA dehydratase